VSVSKPPKRVPEVGMVLDLAPVDTAWGWSGKLLVVRPRPDISLWYGGEYVWVEGQRINDRGEVLPRVEQVLIRCDAIA
jgi:hypothetical protein